MNTKIDSWLRRFRTAHRDRRLVITVHPDLATHITQTRSKVVKNFMWQHWVWLEFTADEQLKPDEFRVYSKRRKADVTDSV